MSILQLQAVFWVSMSIAQAGAFIIFKDLADISQWVVQSNRKFTMAIWYNRRPIAAVSVLALVLALVLWLRVPAVCHGALLAVLLVIFTLNFVAGMFNPKWMFRSQQHRAMFVPVERAPAYLQRSLHLAHFGPESYRSVDDISMLVLETDHGAYAYSDYYLLQPHVVKGDTIQGQDVVMTYCGLTNLGIAYSPVIGGRELDLTVMTQLKNNLVLYDRNSGEAIQQLWGSMERDPQHTRMQEWPTIRMPFAAFKKLYPNGRVFVNDKPVEEYFSRDTLMMDLRQPFGLTDTLEAFDTHVNVDGGGHSGQAGAIRLGIARALLLVNPGYREALKRAGFLTRDARKVERKKYGQAGARRRFQFSKR